MRMAHSGLFRHLREQLRRFDPIRRECDARMAVRGDRLVMAVCGVNLTEILRDQAGLGIDNLFQVVDHLFLAMIGIRRDGLICHF